MKIILQHQWKQYWRSPDKGQNIFSAVMVSLLFILLTGYAALAGFFLPSILQKVLPNQNPVLTINKAVVYYFFISLILRFFLQGVPAQEIDYYRMLPVKRSILIRTLLLKSAANIFNFISIVFFTTFTFNGVIKEYSFLVSGSWLLSILLTDFSISYFIFYFHKKISSIPGILFGLIIFLGLFIITELKTAIGPHNFSFQIFGAIINFPALCIIPGLLLFCIYKLNYTSLQQHLYAEDIKKHQRKGSKSSSRYTLFESFGETGLYIALELKLIFRNKRPRSLFFYSMFFLLYQCFIYYQYFNRPGQGNSSEFMIIFWSVFSPSLGMMTYGQNIYAWDAGYFDLICSRVNNIHKYIIAKYWVMVLACSFSFFMLIPYAFFFGPKALWFNIAGSVYSIGINSVLMLIFGVLNKNRMELNTNMMSMQGRDSKTHFIKGLPILILMGAIYLIVSLLGLMEYIFHVLFFTGLIAFLLRNQFISIALNQFEKQRYKMATGFRQS